MASEDSDDEPLSVLAASKKLHPEKYLQYAMPDIEVEVPKKRKKYTVLKKQTLTIKLNQKEFKPSIPVPPVIERPADVWLYLKDLNRTGPFSCLLCSDWFINRIKMVVHYILNHRKDFCGICRYFITDREAWASHMRFHLPLPCSQCIENFQTEPALRHHLLNAHALVHCRMCHMRMPDDQYNTHLFQKHSITNVQNKDEDVLWDIEFEGSPKFICILCSKTNILMRTFFNHYMCYHHFTLKCFTKLVSGRDVPFLVNGADLSANFIKSLTINNLKCGYVSLEQNTDQILMAIPEIKQEPNDPIDKKSYPKVIEKENTIEHILKTYKGEEDFDVTLMELIVLDQCYFDYVHQTLTDISSNILPVNSNIDYNTAKSGDDNGLKCNLCDTDIDTMISLISHMTKIHSVKFVPTFSCRVCATTFDTQTELDMHLTQELGEFENLWLCQFCDKEFDSRQTTRNHLTDHWDTIEYDNCFSPHLGFKCRYCPTLFWNENDRESHAVRVHFNSHKEEYYRCHFCNEIFSDKIWFIHHFFKQHHSVEVSMPLYLFKCCVCCKVLDSLEKMRSHFKDQHPEARKMFCTLDSCKYKPLSHKKSFRLHLRSVHNPLSRSERAVPCAVCEREFPNARALGAHVSQVHGPGKFKCKLCGELLHSMDERKLHYLLIHPGRHPFECNTCGKSFQYKSSLYMHKQEHEPNRQTYTCSYCQKVFAKRDSYKEHLQIHEGPRHACSYCPMRFVQRSNMLRHERRHTGERPYACPQCHRTFADKGACTSHTRTHVKSIAYTCVYCGQSFRQKSKLKYHTRKHTGENLETCEICSKMFTSCSSLREHVKNTHAAKTGQVNCPLCDRKYQDDRSMLRHLRSAHTGATYSCPICRKLLTSAAGLRHHVVTHSSIHMYRCKKCPKRCSVKKTMIRHLRRRHNLKGNEFNFQDNYRTLDPRQCKLGLDEEVMTSIFGPAKQVFEVIDKLADEPSDNESKEGDNEEPNPESDNKTENEMIARPELLLVQVKEERPDSEEDLEPTDYVTVKIEPTEDDCNF